MVVVVGIWLVFYGFVVVVFRWVSVVVWGFMWGFLFGSREFFLGVMDSGVVGCVFIRFCFGVGCLWEFVVGWGYVLVVGMFFFWLFLVVGV